uniref:Uncharacterized protein n=1 Tax=Anguilla anguilla TaxID=7936 RepID=A0A0E9XUD3_ANGAN
MLLVFACTKKLKALVNQALGLLWLRLLLQAESKGDCVGKRLVLLRWWHTLKGQESMP